MRPGKGRGRCVLVSDAISPLGPLDPPPFFLLLAVEQDCHDQGLPRDARPMAIVTVPLLTLFKNLTGPTTVLLPLPR